MRKHWFSIGGGAIDMTTNAIFLLNSSSFGDAFTILRMLGGYTIGPTAASAAGDRALVTVGVGIVSDAAVAVGSTAIPGPLTEAAYPWLYWESVPFQFGGTAVDPNSQAGSARISFDVKSMRKIKPEESVILAVEYANSTGSPSLSIMVANTRVLVAH